MKLGFLKRVYKIIDKANIVIEVVDARFVEETRNTQLESKITKKGKQLLIAINKSDLAGKKELEKQKKAIGEKCVFLSIRNRKGIARLKAKLSRMAGEKKATIAVIGFPNTGKSSIINAVLGRKAARTSSRAGFTRGEQLIRVTDKIRLIDSPGIIPFQERNPYKLAILAAKNPEQLPEPEEGAKMLIEYIQNKFPEKLEKLLEEETTGKKPIENKEKQKTGEKSLQQAPEEILEKIALKWHRLKKGGQADTQTTSKMLLKKWQNGKI